MATRRAVLLATFAFVALGNGGVALADYPASRRTDITWDYNAQFIVGVTGNTTVASVWNSSDGRFLFGLKGHKERIVRVQLFGSKLLTSSYLPPNEIAKSSQDDSIRVWDLKTGTETLRISNASFAQLSSDRKRVFGISFAEEGKGRVPGLAVWDVNSGKKLFRISLPYSVAHGPSYTMQESADGKSLVCAYRYQAWVVSLLDGSLIRKLELERGAFTNLHFLQSKPGLVRFSQHDTVITYDIQAGKEVERNSLPTGGIFWETDWYPCDSGFVAVEQKGMIVSRINNKLHLRQTNLRLPQSVLAIDAKIGFVVNWGGSHQDQSYVPQKTTVFSASCEPLWEKSGRILSLWDQRAVLLDEGNLLLVSMKNGAILKSIALEKFEK